MKTNLPPGEDDAGEGKYEYQAQQLPALSFRLQQPQPFEPVVEDAQEQEQVSGQAQQTGGGERIEGFVVSTGQGGLFVAPMYGKAEAVVDHTEGFGPIAHQWADGVEGVAVAVGVLEGIVGQDQIHHALPVENTGEGEYLPHPPQPGRALKGLQRPTWNVDEDDEAHQEGNESDDRDDRNRSPFAPPRQGQQQEEKKEADEKREQGAAALSVPDGHQLYGGDERVAHRAQDVGPVDLLPGQGGSKALHHAAEGEGEDHDEIGGEEDGVAHTGRYARRRIADPGHWVEAVVLDETVEGDGQAVDDDDGYQPIQLGAGAQPLQDHQEDDDVGKGGEGALQPQVGADQADPGGDR